MAMEPYRAPLTIAMPAVDFVDQTAGLCRQINRCGHSASWAWPQLPGAATRIGVLCRYGVRNLGFDASALSSRALSPTEIAIALMRGPEYDFDDRSSGPTVPSFYDDWQLPLSVPLSANAMPFVPRHLD